MSIHKKKKANLFVLCFLLGGKIMNKTELVAAVAAKAELSKKDAEAAVNAVFDSVKDALAEGDKVSLIGFGTFSVVERKARTGINPQTKEKIKIKASKVVKFKPGAAFKASK